MSEAPATLPTRPRCRAQCKNGPRPCPWVSCRYHLYLNVCRGGRLRFKWGPDVIAALEKMPDTCALDVADRGPTDERTGVLTWAEVGRRFNITHMAVILEARVAHKKMLHYLGRKA